LGHKNGVWSIKTCSPLEQYCVVCFKLSCAVLPGCPGKEASTQVCVYSTQKSIKHKISDDEEELNFKFIKVTFVD